MKALSFVTLLSLLPAPSLQAADAPVANAAAPTASIEVIDLGAPSAEFVPLPTQVDLVSVSRASGEVSGLDVAIRPGPAKYPGVNFRLAPGKLDLSAYGFIEARLTNTSAKPIYATLRIDSASAPTLGLRASEAFGRIHLTPGSTGNVRAYFSQPKKGMGPFNPAHLDMILLYLAKDEADARSFRLESITASGAPGEVPAPAPASAPAAK